MTGLGPGCCCDGQAGGLRSLAPSRQGNGCCEQKQYFHCLLRKNLETPLHIAVKFLYNVILPGYCRAGCSVKKQTCRLCLPLSYKDKQTRRHSNVSGSRFMPRSMLRIALLSEFLPAVPPVVIYLYVPTVRQCSFCRAPEVSSEGGRTVTAAEVGICRSVLRKAAVRTRNRSVGRTPCPLRKNGPGGFLLKESLPGSVRSQTVTSACSP